MEVDKITLKENTIVSDIHLKIERNKNTDLVEISISHQTDKEKLHKIIYDSFFSQYNNYFLEIIIEKLFLYYSDIVFLFKLDSHSPNNLSIIAIRNKKQECLIQLFHDSLYYITITNSQMEGAHTYSYDIFTKQSYTANILELEKVLKKYVEN